MAFDSESDNRSLRRSPFATGSIYLGMFVYDENNKKKIQPILEIVNE